MKKILWLIASLVVSLTYFNCTAMAKDEVSVTLDGMAIDFDVPAQVVNGRTLVPVRKIFEELGMVVDWDGENQSVTAYKKGVFLELTINSTTVYRNSVEHEVDVPAQVIDGRTLVPVRVVSEFAGADVVWDGNTNTVIISSLNNIQYINWNEYYDYWGEVNDTYACGYGVLYRKEDNTISQMGLYENSKIVKGMDLFTDGEFFIGDYENGRRKNGVYQYSNGEYYVGEFKNSEMYKGAYYYNDGVSYVGEWRNGQPNGYGTFNYASGDSYTGDIVNAKRHGTGTYFYADGSYHKGDWKENLPNGYGIMHDVIENVQYEGNYINGNRDGEFVIKDFFLNKVYYATYDNGTYIDEEYIQRQNQIAYEEERAILIEWAEEEVENIYEEGDEIYEKILNKVDTSGSYGDNLDSFAAANAMRQQNALMKQYKKQAEAAKQEYIAEQLEMLADYVQEKDNELKEKYNIK